MEQYKYLPVFDKELISFIGRFYENDKNSSFDKFVFKKPQGVIRIGCFGDSFTHGDEVSAFFDYPTILQEMLNKRFPGKYQVLNFGVGWTGLSQAFFMFNRFGGKYRLDYVVFGPMFFMNRDITFCHDDAVWYIHGRYIIKKDNKLEVYSPEADFDLKTRAVKYNKFIPQCNYLYFDRNPPAMVKCLLPRFSGVDNPVYYNRGNSIRSEFLLLLQLILQAIPSQYKKVLISADDSLISYIDKKDIANLTTKYTLEKNNFPYKAAAGHYSPYGNYYIAAQVYQCILKEKQILDNISFIDCYSSSKTDENISSKQVVFLNDFDKVYLSIDSKPVGFFVRKNCSFYEGFRIGKHTSAILKDDNIKGLIGVVTANSSILDATFYAITDLLSVDSVVDIEGCSVLLKKLYPFNIGIVYTDRRPDSIIYKGKKITRFPSYTIRARGDDMLWPFPKGFVYLVALNSSGRLQIPIAQSKFFR